MRDLQYKNRKRVLLNKSVEAILAFKFLTNEIWIINICLQHKNIITSLRNTSEGDNRLYKLLTS